MSSTLGSSRAIVARLWAPELTATMRALECCRRAVRSCFLTNITFSTGMMAQGVSVLLVRNDGAVLLVRNDGAGRFSF